ncbi:MAG TPA: plastocyanin/azurin family copper-binding protein [Gemmatimonadales bacterium]|nr:plastocyanin/azurin family copper-binding protein [Gemmatimonadales bacterium]
MTIALNATAGAAVSIVKTAGDGGAAAPSSQVTYTVQSRDSHGNPKGGVTVDWAVGTGAGSITPGQNTTLVNGNASAQRTLGAGTGDQTATATANGLSGTPSVTFTTTAATVTTVDVGPGLVFSPNAITITVGTIVTWAWQGTTPAHNVTFANATGVPANIGDMTSGSAQRTFNTAGVFTYQCTNHPVMTGTVTVNP